jgi:hypothetical protein
MIIMAWVELVNSYSDTQKFISNSVKALLKRTKLFSTSLTR